MPCLLKLCGISCAVTRNVPELPILVNYRQDKFNETRASTDKQVGLQDEDVEMTDESQDESRHSSRTDLRLDCSLEEAVDAKAMVNAALSISEDAVDAVGAGNKQAEAQLLAEMALALSEASLEGIDTTEPGSPQSKLLATSANVAHVESLLYQEASVAAKEIHDEKVKAADAAANPPIPPPSLPKSDMYGLSAQNLLGTTRRPPAPTPAAAPSFESLSSTKSQGVDRAVKATLTQLLATSQPNASTGPTSGGYITMDDLRHCVFHQGMHLRFRRRAMGVLPRMPKVKRQ